ncbi:shikimate dehydrogenase [Shewanella sp. GXUN23E]|uniref:shikimate dehydrogenase n=1 Tax=Shewanella sp. GXUN23E TaxID=3422498 RepID=UPI003D7D5957
MSDRYTVFGNPIAHSKSPVIHASFAAQTHQDMSYDTSLVPLDGFEMAVRRFMAQGGRGANVTVPFKEQAYQLCDQLSDEARLAGAVNTLSFSDDGRIYGDNTDGRGLVADLERHIRLQGKRILLLGAGGAARGAILPLLQAKPAELVICNRTESKAQALAALFRKYGGIRAEAITTPGRGFDIVINSTSASLAGELPPVPAEIFNADTLCYDMMYGADMTAFNRWASAQGVIHTLDGLGMLVGQAAIAFKLWRNVMPDVDVVLASLRSRLEA